MYQQLHKIYKRRFRNKFFIKSLMLGLNSIM